MKLSVCENCNVRTYGHDYMKILRKITRKKLIDNQIGENITGDIKHSKIDNQKFLWQYRCSEEPYGHFNPVCNKDDANQISILDEAGIVVAFIDF